MQLDAQVKQSIETLSTSISIKGPFETGHHINFIVSGLCDNDEQLEQLCWILLSFIGEICTKDLEIISVIDAGLGKGFDLKTEICKAMKNNWLIPANEIDIHEREDKITKNRNPLIFELIAHTLLILQKENSSLSFAGAVPKQIRPPHINANEPGIDLIAIVEKDEILPLIGEMKAYETDPGNGLIIACQKFNEVNEGKHNPEIRRTLRDQLSDYPKERISQKMWETEGLFSAVIGSDSEHSKKPGFSSRSDVVKNVECKTLLFIATPFIEMNILFERIIQVLSNCINKLVE
jgi:hypothetical protein